MPIVKCEASKATPMKGIAYIMDRDKTLASGSQNLMEGDPESMARQMMETMLLHGKGKNPNERKYYHCKISFDPQDLKQNGGDLDEKKANLYATKYAHRMWPGREVVWSVQHHGTAMHIHLIVAACHLETGKKLDARHAEYRRWKTGAQELAEKMGLSTLDWESATKTKRTRECEVVEPVSLTFAEKGLKARGKGTWKDELRWIIDEAVATSTTMEGFRDALEAQGVTMTRCTDQTMSYKLGEHRACRGDTLGGAYTAKAIRAALERQESGRQDTDADRRAREAAWTQYKAIRDGVWESFLEAQRADIRAIRDLRRANEALYQQHSRVVEVDEDGVEVRELLPRAQLERAGYYEQRRQTSTAMAPYEQHLKSLRGYQAVARQRQDIVRSLLLAGADERTVRVAMAEYEEAMEALRSYGCSQGRSDSDGRRLKAARWSAEQAQRRAELKIQRLTEEQERCALMDMAEKEYDHFARTGEVLADEQPQTRGTVRPEIGDDAR